MTIYVMKKLEKNMDGVPDGNSFIGCFKQWFELKTSETRDSLPVQQKFIEEFLAGDMTYAEEYQSAGSFYLDKPLTLQLIHLVCLSLASCAQHPSPQLRRTAADAAM